MKRRTGSPFYRGGRLGILLALAVSVGFWRPPVGTSQETLPGFGIPQLVRLDPKAITPAELSIKKGATVIWLNATQGFVTVVFTNGEEVAEAAQSTTRFFLAPDGTMTSNAFGPGAVASLSFVGEGQYRYFVSGVGGDLSKGEGAFGKIVVVGSGDQVPLQPSGK